MTARITRFPPRRSQAIWIDRERDGLGGWLVLYQSNGWIFDSSAEAYTDAVWLSRNTGVPIRATLSS
jgi:hypothetical protein